MKFMFVIAFLAACAVVGAAPVETNGQRMARGLPPLYPANLKRGTPVDLAKRGKPSGVDAAKRGKPSGVEAAKRGKPSNVEAAKRGKPSGL